MSPKARVRQLAGRTARLHSDPNALGTTYQSSILVDFSGACVRGLVEASVIGICAARKSEKVRQQLQRHEEDERRQPFFHGGNREPVDGRFKVGIVWSSCGNMKHDAMSSCFACCTDDHTRTFVCRTAGEERDERNAFINFGERAVAELLRLLAFGGRETRLFDFQGDLASYRPIGPRAY